jgi:hypothetical protein
VEDDAQSSGEISTRARSEGRDRRKLGMVGFPFRDEALILFCLHNETTHWMVNRHSEEISKAVNLPSEIEEDLGSGQKRGKA